MMKRQLIRLVMFRYTGMRNTINGYTLDGKKLQKASRGDGLDRYLASQNDPTTGELFDAYNDREVVLSDRQMLLIRRIMSGSYAHRIQWRLCVRIPTQYKYMPWVLRLNQNGDLYLQVGATKGTENSKGYSRRSY